MKLLLVRRIDCLSGACNLEDAAVLPKVQKGTSSLASSLSSCLLQGGNQPSESCTLAAVKEHSLGGQKGDLQPHCHVLTPCHMWGIPKLCSPLGASQPGMAPVEELDGAVSPGLGRTLEGRGW